MSSIQLAESLPIWSVANEWTKESPGTTRLTWLVHMAIAIYENPPKLLLRSDESWDWKTKKTGRRVIGNLLTGEFERPEDRYDIIRYDKNISPLKLLAEPQISTDEPAWITPQAFVEKIHREDFHAWCKSVGHPLPRFWFPEEMQQQSATQDEELSPQPTLSAEEISVRGKRLRWPDEKIAAEILKNFPTIENYALGKLLPAKPGTNIADNSHKKRGQRLREKALKIILKD